MKKYIMTFDQGTTSSRCVLYDQTGKAVCTAQKEFSQIYPQPGWVEHDPMEIWSTQIGVASEALYRMGVAAEEIEAIGIANQRETTVVWDRHTGLPICNAIVWQCRRTAAHCDALIQQGLSETFKQKTGLPIDAYFSATKIRWILDHVDGAKAKAENGDLLFGTIETWLIWRLTGGRVHVTDYSNASRTMLFNIHELKWDEELLKILEIPKSMLPEVKPSSFVYGETETTIFGAPIKIAGAAGDQQAALFGQACFQKGEAKNTYGTGGFLLMNTGQTPVESQNGLITTIGWGISDKIYYALEGSVFVAGAAVQWLRDELRLIDRAADSEEISKQVPDTNGVYVVPAFVGLGAPHWNPHARGAIFGLTRGAGKAHLVRATLESIAYQTYDLIKAIEKDSGLSVSVLKVDGGAAANDFLMQFQADILHAEVKRPSTIETTSLGAAYLAGLAVGYWKDEEDILQNLAIGKAFSPEMMRQKRVMLLSGWKRALRSCLTWGDEF